MAERNSILAHLPMILPLVDAPEDSPHRARTAWRVLQRRAAAFIQAIIPQPNWRG